jgi:hypothetical protein
VGSVEDSPDVGSTLDAGGETWLVASDDGTFSEVSGV